MHQKLVPDSFFILVNNQSSHCMQAILLKIRYFEKGIIKNPLPVAPQVMKQVHKNFFISCVLSDQV